MEERAESKENAASPKADDRRPIAAESEHPRRLYVGNLSYAAREIDLIRAFGEFGRLAAVEIVFHRKGPDAGRPRGFAFVEFEQGANARKAVKALNDTRFLGRHIVVRACEPDELRDLGAKNGATSGGGSSSAAGAGAGGGGNRAQKRAQLDAIDAKIASLRAKLQKKSH
jgi:RNA recognition motif-containing protein